MVIASFLKRSPFVAAGDLHVMILLTVTTAPPRQTNQPTNQLTTPTDTNLHTTSQTPRLTTTPYHRHYHHNHQHRRHRHRTLHTTARHHAPPTSPPPPERPSPSSVLAGSILPCSINSRPVKLEERLQTVRPGRFTRLITQLHVSLRLLAVVKAFFLPALRAR